MLRLLDALESSRRETMYADDDFLFSSVKLRGKQPRSGSHLVEEYPRRVIREKDDVTYGPHGEVVKRFGFQTFRHSLATCLTDEQENPAVVQAIMRHTRWISRFTTRSRRSAKHAAQERVLQRLMVPAVAPAEMWVRVGPKAIQ